MAACAEVISPLAFYGAPKSQLYAVLSCKNYFPPHFSFLGSLPVSIASAPEQAKQLPPKQAPPVGPAGSGRGPLRTVGDAATPAPQPWPASVARGSRGHQQERLAAASEVPVWAGAQKQQFPARRGKGRTCFSPGTAFSGMEEGAGGGTAALLHGSCWARGECWGRATGATKNRPQGTRSEEAVVLPSQTACPYTPSPRRWKTPNLGGKLQYSRR